MSRNKKNNNNSEDSIKIALIGNEYVGKTSIVRRYVHHGYDTGYIRTIGGDLWHKKVVISNGIVNLNILDTGGEKQQRDLITNLFRNTDGVMLVYDINNVSSFESVDSWIELLVQHAEKEPVIVLVGNKSDLRKDNMNQETGESVRLFSNQVSLIDLKSKARKHGIKYCEVSAKTGRNIEEPFITLLQEVYLKQDEAVVEYGGSLVHSLTGPEGHCCCAIS